MGIPDRHEFCEDEPHAGRDDEAAEGAPAHDRGMLPVASFGWDSLALGELRVFAGAAPAADGAGAAAAAGDAMAAAAVGGPVIDSAAQVADEAGATVSTACACTCCVLRSTTVEMTICASAGMAVVCEVTTASHTFGLRVRQARARVASSPPPTIWLMISPSAPASKMRWHIAALPSAIVPIAVAASLRTRCESDCSSAHSGPTRSLKSSSGDSLARLMTDAANPHSVLTTGVSRAMDGRRRRRPKIEKRTKSWTTHARLLAPTFIYYTSHHCSVPRPSLVAQHTHSTYRFFPKFFLKVPHARDQGGLLGVVCGLLRGAMADADTD